MTKAASDLALNRDRDAAKLIPFAVLSLAGLEEPGEVACPLRIGRLNEFAEQIGESEFGDSALHAASSLDHRCRHSQDVAYLGRLFEVGRSPSALPLSVSSEMERAR